MKNNNLIINELESTLSLWEDMCAMATLRKMATKIRNKEIRGFTSSIMNGFPGVKNHVNLRVRLQNGDYFGESDFLPIVPKDSETYLDKVTYARGAPLNGPACAFYPYILSNWVRTKKVFRFANADVIPLLNPKEKSCLHLLPCDSFVLSFNQPFEIGFETSSLVKEYTTAIVTRSGNMVSTFWMPSSQNIESRLLEYKDRVLLRDILRRGKIDERKLGKFFLSITAPNSRRMLGDFPYFVNLSFRIDQPLIFFCRAQRSFDKRVIDIYHDVYGKKIAIVEEYNGRFSEADRLSYSEIEDSAMEDSVHFYKFFFELLNGFCYAISEIKPRNLKISEQGKDIIGASIEHPSNWYEIPITKIDYLEDNEEIPGELKISYGSGEKSPHIRRGHWRNILKKDGLKTMIWIEQTMVRADKLEKEGLKGNVTLVRQKREY